MNSGLGSTSQRGLPEAQVASLREVAARYAAGCPFKPGDLVTARRGGFYMGQGEPAVVLEVFDPPFRFHDGENGSGYHFARYDMRVARVHDAGVLAAFAVESWGYETYAGADA